jgi:adenine phosphoribosyltransferase
MILIVALSGRQLRSRLQELFVWQGDYGDDAPWADATGWWRDAEVVAALGPALAGLFMEEPPTVVLGVESRGSLLGALVAAQLGVGLLEVRKDRSLPLDGNAWLHAATPPDYRGRQVSLGMYARHVNGGERVLAVDDWIDTGSQMTGARELVEQAGASWVGLAVVVDGLAQSPLRSRLRVRSLLSDGDL